MRKMLLEMKSEKVNMWINSFELRAKNAKTIKYFTIFTVGDIFELSPRKSLLHFSSIILDTVIEAIHWWNSLSSIGRKLINSKQYHFWNHGYWGVFKLKISTRIRSS